MSVSANCLDGSSCHTQISLAVGCVTFPVFVLVWYYYSKKYCKSVGTNSNDAFDTDSSSDDGEFDFMQYHEHETRRFVKWINRSNVFQIHESEMHSAQELFGSCLGVEPPVDSSSDDILANSANYKSSHEGTSDAESHMNDSCAGVFWECLPEATI